MGWLQGIVVHAQIVLLHLEYLEIRVMQKNEGAPTLSHPLWLSLTGAFTERTTKSLAHSLSDSLTL